MKMDPQKNFSNRDSLKVIFFFYLGLLLLAGFEILMDWLLITFTGLRSFSMNNALFIISVCLMLGGQFLILWSVISLYQTGKGTPYPVFATRTLVTSGPYQFVRNPMTFGAFLFYFGLGVYLGSPVLLIFVSAIFTILLIFIYRHETKELGERFGGGYENYRQKVPFILPGFQLFWRWMNKNKTEVD